MNIFTKKNKLRNGLIFVAALCLIAIGCQKDQIEVPEDYKISLRDVTDFCIASYNTFLLDTPDLSGGPQCEGLPCSKRAHDVCRFITLQNGNVPDIVTFQEVFEPGACSTLLSCMTGAGFAFNTGCGFAVDPASGIPDCECGFVAPKGSGLITFSKFPITLTIFEPFNDEYGCLGSGSDCASNKGILLTDIMLPDSCIISVINTHLDAGEDGGSIDARNKQFDQLLAFINQNIPSNQSMFLNGDFNIDVGNTIESDFRDDLNITPTFVLAGTAPGSTASNNQVLDYIFVKNGDGKILNTTYEVIKNSVSFTFCYWTFTDAWFQANKQDYEYHYENINGEPHEPVEPGYLPSTPEQIGTWPSFEDVPKPYRQHVERKCVSEIFQNPSDHDPIMSCMSYDCDGVIELPDDVTISTEPECNSNKPCPTGEECIKGKCQLL